MAFAYSLRTRNNFDPKSKEPFRISRSKIDLFTECPRCFYLDQRLGIKRPDTPPFSLNNAVDLLLKKEFDIHRADATAHPLMKAYGLDAVPFKLSWSILFGYILSILTQILINKYFFI
jgi:hypothetical protein